MGNESGRANNWNSLYNQTPLIYAPFHFANLANSPFMMRYLTTVLHLCPRGGRSLETGIGTAHGAIWLWKRSVCTAGAKQREELTHYAAAGIAYSREIPERARQAKI